MTSPREFDNFDDFVGAIDKQGSRFDVLDTSDARPLGVSVSDVRRRRGRLADDDEYRCEAAGQPCVDGDVAPSGAAHHLQATCSRK
jgi:hypothetical protein